MSQKNWYRKPYTDMRRNPVCDMMFHIAHNGCNIYHFSGSSTDDYMTEAIFRLYVKQRPKVKYHSIHLDDNSCISLMHEFDVKQIMKQERDHAILWTISKDVINYINILKPTYTYIVITGIYGLNEQEITKIYTALSSVTYSDHNMGCIVQYMPLIILDYHASTQSFIDTLSDNSDNAAVQNMSIITDTDASSAQIVNGLFRLTHELYSGIDVTILEMIDAFSDSVLYQDNDATPDEAKIIFQNVSYDDRGLYEYIILFHLLHNGFNSSGKPFMDQFVDHLIEVIEKCSSRLHEPIMNTTCELPSFKPTDRCVECARQTFQSYPYCEMLYQVAEKYFKEGCYK